MYAIVKKQDEKIDELLKVNKQNNEMLSSIETRMVSMSTQPTAQNESRGKIEVELPPNIATENRTCSPDKGNYQVTQSTRTSESYPRCVQGNNADGIQSRI